MKYIKKRREPKSLTQYRATPGAYYDGYRDKDELLQALMEEQGFICCYCMQGIKPETAHIEHWRSQKLYPDLQLEYKNLLVVCDGNKGYSQKLQHCDQSKRDKEISVDPTKPDCETQVKFSFSGIVYSDNEKIDRELNTVLHLNLQMFQMSRKTILDIAIRNLLAVKTEGKWSKTFLEKQIRKWESLGADGKYEPYCRVVIYYLEKKLSRYS